MISSHVGQRFGVSLNYGAMAAASSYPEEGVVYDVSYAYGHCTDEYCRAKSPEPMVSTRKGSSPAVMKKAMFHLLLR